MFHVTVIVPLRIASNFFTRGKILNSLKTEPSHRMLTLSGSLKYSFYISHISHLNITYLFWAEI